MSWSARTPEPFTADELKRDALILEPEEIKGRASDQVDAAILAAVKLLKGGAFGSETDTYDVALSGNGEEPEHLTLMIRQADLET